MASHRWQLDNQISSCTIWDGQSDTGTSFLRVHLFFPSHIIPPILYTHLHLHVALTRKTNGQNLGTFQEAKIFRKSGNIGQGTSSLQRVYNLTNQLQSSWMPIHPPSFLYPLNAFFPPLPLLYYHRLRTLIPDLFNSCLSILIFHHETVNVMYG